MKNLCLVAASLSFLAVSCGNAVAQQRNDPQFNGGRPPVDEHGNNHPDWRKGARIAHDDWALRQSITGRATFVSLLTAMSGAKSMAASSWPPLQRA